MSKNTKVPILLTILIIFSLNLAFAQQSIADYSSPDVSGEATYNAPQVHIGDPGTTYTLNQAPNAVNGLFSDPGCEFCGTGQQSIADNFVITTAGPRFGITELVMWGGYFPEDIPNTTDDFGILVHTDAAGIPGTVVYSQSGLQPTSRVATGNVLFGVDEYMFTFDLRAIPIMIPTNGTYWIEIFNNSVATSGFFWETGDLDVTNGLPFFSFDFQVPGVNWILSAPYDMAIRLTGGDLSASISGNVKDADGVAVEGADVTFSNGGATVSTDVNGNYITSVALGWHGFSTIEKDGWTFEPMTINYPNKFTTDITNQDFVGTQLPTQIFISGYLKDMMNNGIEGATIAFDNGGPTTTTNMYGYYIAYFSYGWNGISTIAKDGYDFTPAQYEYPNHLWEDQLDQNFTASMVSAQTLGVNDNNSLPNDFTILPAYPNPFNPSTTIEYGINEDNLVTIEIYDIAGQLITSLLNTNQAVGWHSVEWNGTNQNGENVPAGMYLSKISAGNDVRTTKLMLVK